MEQYFDTRWPDGRVMMRNTASVQVNVDLGAPALVESRWTRAHDLVPVLAAAFANSPFDAHRRGHGMAFVATRRVAPHRSAPHARVARNGAERGVGVDRLRARRPGDDDRHRVRVRPHARVRCRSRVGSTKATNSDGRPSTTSSTTSPRCSRRYVPVDGSSCALSMRSPTSGGRWRSRSPRPCSTTRRPPTW